MKVANLNTFQLFLQLLIKWYSKDESCWVQIANVSNIYSLPLDLNNTIQVLNPKTCVPGCNHYILHDPLISELSSFLKNCIIQSKYKFNGIIFQSNESTTQYRMWMDFAQASIFIKQGIGEKSDSLVVSKFTDWNLTKPEVINYWNMTTNAFVYPVDFHNVPEFFSVKKINNAKVASYYAASVPPSVIYEPKVAGIHLHLMEEYTKKINVTWEARRFHPNNITSYLSAFFVAGIKVNFATMEVSRNRIGIIVPKETVEIQLTNIFEVFSWEIWIFILLTYSVMLVYFLSEKYFLEYQGIGFTLPFNIYFVQPFANREIPRIERQKVMYCLILLFILWISKCYETGLLRSLILPRYGRGVESWEDMNKLQYPIYWHNNPIKTFNRLEDPIQLSVFSRWTNNTEVLKNRHKSFQMHYITDNDISSMLYDKFDLKSEHVESLNNIFSFLVYDYIGLDAGSFLHCDVINKLILQCREAGLLIKWEWEAYLLKLKMFDILNYLDKSKRNDASVQLTIDHLLGLFLALTVGLLLAIVVFSIECFLYF